MKKAIIVLEIIVLIFFLFWHFRLGLVRYFDADEFAHLHWGYSFSIGEKPYTDFFYLFPPFFLYPIAGIFKIFGRTTVAILNARMFIFFIFAATNGILFLLVKKLRNVHFALLTLIFFSFLPLPFDKMIEVRPDLIATCLSLAGLYLFIKGNEEEKGNRGKYYFLSGLSYAAGLGFVPKTIFFLVPVGLVITVRYLKNCGRSSKERNSYGLYFFLGMVPVAAILLFVISSFGNISFAIYSMTRMASEITKTLGEKFYMRPDLFFYPNETYYGLNGWSSALVLNLIIYVSASVWAIHRLITSLSLSDDKKCFREFLIAGSLFANLAAFVYFYPLKHVQYLIPVAPFIAFYFVDLLFSVKESFHKLMRPHLFMKLAGEMSIGLIVVVIVVVGWQMNQKKEQWVNKPAFDKMDNFLRIIPADAPVYDLSGETIFFPNGYYFCCLPYGQYEESLYFTIPDITKEMETKKTNYVYLGWMDRLNEIPIPHAKYIMDNFVPITPDKLLLMRKKE